MSVSFWEVRTPYGDDESFNSAKNRITESATLLGIKAQWQAGRGQKGMGPRYHFWRLYDEQDAVNFYFTHGDRIINRAFKRKEQLQGATQ